VLARSGTTRAPRRRGQTRAAPPHATLALALLALAGVACTPPQSRPAVSPEALWAQRADDDAQRQAQTRQIIDTMIARARHKQAATPDQAATLDILVISGGGDWGAFGAGVLRGWGQGRGEMARPRFDVVTGVSTGALIAPFAFLGDQDAIDRINSIYRHPEPDWAKPRGPIYFWPTNPSFYVMPGLERAVRQTVNRDMLQHIVDASAEHRQLIVNTTNVDYADMHAWELGREARFALANNQPDHVPTLLLASAGVPGVFPARQIDGRLYVDGAITGNILYGARLGEDDSFWARWAQQHPDTPPPRLRYWIILNNQLRFPPQIIEMTWPAIIGRATVMATQNATVNGIRHLHAIAEIARLRHDAEVEVRLMAIPDDWVPPEPGVFNRRVMNGLADLGQALAADPTHWQTTPP